MCKVEIAYVAADITLPQHSFFPNSNTDCKSDRGFRGYAMSSKHLHKQASKVIVAYVANNSLPSTVVPELIGRVYAALIELNQPITTWNIAAASKTKAEIAASCKHEYLISFINGRPYQALKRHLTAHGLTPQSYRARFALPHDYPMVAPAYAARRSRIAKQILLGHAPSK